MQVLEQEVTQLRRACTEHTARFRLMDAGSSNDATPTALGLNGLSHPGLPSLPSHLSAHDSMSLDNPAIDELARKAFDTYVASACCS